MVDVLALETGDLRTMNEGEWWMLKTRCVDFVDVVIYQIIYYALESGRLYKSSHLQQDLCFHHPKDHAPHELLIGDVDVFALHPHGMTDDIHMLFDK